MRIGLEIFGVPGITPAEGQARYAFFLAKALLALNRRHDFVLFYNSFRQPVSRDILARSLETDRFTLVHTRIPFTDSSHWLGDLKYYWWTRHAGQHNLDLFHGTSFQGLPKGKISSIITIHDIAPEILDMVPVREQWRKRTIRSINQADAIIAISEHTHRDLVNRWKISQEKIHTVPQGYNLPLTGKVEDSEHTGQPYFLYVGSFRPNKNIPTLLKAFAMVSRKQRNVRLVLVGGAGSDKQRIREIAAMEGISQRLEIPGFVSDQELEQSYCNAIALVHPSLYEGFGMTVLEAMGRGCPVISSNAASLPEVVGDGGIMVDPKDHEAMAREMLRVLVSDALRNDLRKKGLERAKEFTWTKAAAATMTVYEKTINPEPSPTP